MDLAQQNVAPDPFSHAARCVMKSSAVLGIPREDAPRRETFASGPSARRMNGKRQDSTLLADVVISRESSMAIVDPAWLQPFLEVLASYPFGHARS